MTAVSVIIPTYNRCETLPRAINSVLDQTYGDFELLIVDDGSTDSTDEVIQSFDDPRVQHLRHETNINASAARNTGLDAASGEYIALLDSDDEWHQKKLEKQINILTNYNKDCIGVYCGVERNRSSKIKTLAERFFSEFTGLEGGEELLPHVLSAELALHAGSTFIGHSQPVLETKFDEEFNRHQDLEFLVRFLQRGKIRFVEEQLVTLHDTGYVSPDALITEKTRYLRKYSDLVVQHELQGHDIISNHQFEISKSLFRTNNYTNGINYFRRADIPNIRQGAALLWAVIKGS